MAVKIRLARHGAKKAPFYRVVVADGRARRDGRFLEIVGRYNPRTQPSTVELDLEKIDAWIAKGAQPTEAAAKLIAIARGEKSLPEITASLSKKATAKIAAEAAAAEKAKEDAAAAKAAAKEEAAAAVVAEEAADELAEEAVEVEEAAEALEEVAEEIAEEAVVAEAVAEVEAEAAVEDAVVAEVEEEAADEAADAKTEAAE